MGGKNRNEKKDIGKIFYIFPRPDESTGSTFEITKGEWKAVSERLTDFYFFSKEKCPRIFDCFWMNGLPCIRAEKKKDVQEYLKPADRNWEALEFSEIDEKKWTKTNSSTGKTYVRIIPQRRFRQVSPKLI